MDLRKSAWVMLVVMGLLCLVISLSFVIEDLVVYDDAILTEGIVIDLVPKKNSIDQTIYSAKVEFGENKTFVSRIGTHSTYDLGEKVEVYYWANSEKNPRINSFVDRWLIPLILGIAGLILFPLSVANLKK